MQEAVVILHDIRSAHNVGSIFRTADAAGVSKIYLSGYTPTPKDRFGRTRADIAKTALGAEASILWEYRTDPLALVAELKDQGFFVIAVEQASHAKDYRDIVLPRRAAFIFGREVEGIAPELLSYADAVAEIPMHGRKESLNVSVAAGVALFRMLGR